ncbi:MoaD/ThiS family protein [Desulfitibacter alkalitolerans]|uniref:MoaD/ThiS family protein n=1 Tax=Desulfitibacter alkalitolerans TaxID=264641 RepID=UPI0012EC05AF|nr:MoaD/ThiS family protein [Desulfitibacter alkalitolerans]
MVTIQLTRGMISYPEESKGVIKVEAGEDTTVEEVLFKANINLKEVGMVLRDQKKIDLNEKVNEGDYLHVLPVICGG